MTVSVKALRCRTCGGSISAAPGKALPACLFCGSDTAALVPYDPPEDVEDPVGHLPFAVTVETARQAFQRFARSSFWYPSDLRQARLELRRLLLPAWAWNGRVETHWTGQVRARTSSGRRPVSGSEVRDFEQLLVPASAALTLQELTALGAYDEGELRPFTPQQAEDPHEIGELTRSAARQKALLEMERRHRALIRDEQQLVNLHASSISLGLEGRPVLVPVYIGAYRYGDRVFRVLVNGQSGRLKGEAPVSLWRVAAVALAVLFVLAVIASCLGVFGMCGGVAVLI